MGGRSVVTVAFLAAVAALGPANSAAAVPEWANDPNVYLSGLVRYEGADQPNWVWFDTETDDNGFAELSAVHSDEGQYARWFAIVPREGVPVTATWSCGPFTDLYSTTFVLRRALWGRELTVNVCPESPCLG